VSRVARKVLADFAGAELEDAMADTFIAQLKALTKKPLQNLRTEAEAAKGQITIDSAFALAPKAKARLTKAIRETIHAEADVTFRRETDLVCGLRLKVRGQTLQWSVDAYLDDLEEETDALLDAAAGVGEPKAAE
jgi:hypothetical protein